MDLVAYYKQLAEEAEATPSSADDGAAAAPALPTSNSAPRLAAGPRPPPGPPPPGSVLLHPPPTTTARPQASPPPLPSTALQTTTAPESPRMDPTATATAVESQLQQSKAKLRALRSALRAELQARGALEDALREERQAHSAARERLMLSEVTIRRLEEHLVAAEAAAMQVTRDGEATSHASTPSTSGSASGGASTEGAEHLARQIEELQINLQLVNRDRVMLHGEIASLRARVGKADQLLAYILSIASSPDRTVDVRNSVLHALRYGAELATPVLGPRPSKPHAASAGAHSTEAPPTPPDSPSLAVPRPISRSSSPLPLSLDADDVTHVRVEPTHDTSWAANLRPVRSVASKHAEPLHLPNKSDRVARDREQLSVKSHANNTTDEEDEDDGDDGKGDEALLARVRRGILRSNIAAPPAAAAATTTAATATVSNAPSDTSTTIPETLLDDEQGAIDDAVPPPVFPPASGALEMTEFGEAPASEWLPFEEEAFENQRYLPIRGWSKPSLPLVDPAPFARSNGATCDFETLAPPPGWRWSSNWRVEVPSAAARRDPDAPADADGWEYSADFSGFFHWHAAPHRFDTARRRRWTRMREYVGGEEDLCAPAGEAAAAAAEAAAVTSEAVSSSEGTTGPSHERSSVTDVSSAPAPPPTAPEQLTDEEIFARSRTAHLAPTAEQAAQLSQAGNEIVL